jgi:hypothetical protein
VVLCSALLFLVFGSCPWLCFWPLTSPCIRHHNRHHVRQHGTTTVLFYTSPLSLWLIIVDFRTAVVSGLALILVLGGVYVFFQTRSRPNHGPVSRSPYSIPTVPSRPVQAEAPSSFASRPHSIPSLSYPSAKVEPSPPPPPPPLLDSSTPAVRPPPPPKRLPPKAQLPTSYDSQFNFLKLSDRSQTFHEVATGPVGTERDSPDSVECRNQDRQVPSPSFSSHDFHSLL